MQNFRRAFSLIELLVVISIVGILSAIAVPAYRQYSIRQKLSAIIPYQEMLLKKSITFAQTHGRFANFYDLNMQSPESGDGETYYTNPGPELAPTGSMSGSPDYYMGLYDDDAGTECGRRGSIFYILNPQYFGFSSDITYLDVTFLFGNVNNAIVTYCVFSYGASGGDSGTDNLFPGCINANTTNAWDSTNFNQIFDELQNSATCMN